ncbi:uncharacterized protein LOC116297270 [Actinia tenebrosa]|uniref:Uncharacterized protein LOC116297270 n=1 Tax=Actinia tenebrosa TaxID=6105 RepID=A0A6P8HY81_ACTTE|nr:uncharacterized protein LOC116297270 [Actinia tenebrosa]
MEEQIPNFSVDIDEVKEPERKKSRFAVYSEKDLDNLVDESQAKSTKYATAYAVSVFKEWASSKGIEEEIAIMSKEELNDNLKSFYAEARNKDGGNYSKSTLLGFRNGIERYLSNPPHKKSFHIATDPAFKQSNQILDAKLKSMKKKGESNVQHKPAIEPEDLRRLKESQAISPTTPQGLLFNVWFHITLYFCRRGREGQRNIKKSSFAFLRDENSRPYATMTHDEATKTRQGGLDDRSASFEKLGRIYQTDHPNDGYHALCLYVEKLNPECEAFFQFPKRFWNGEQEKVWFERRCLGVNKLGEMMKDLSRAANLSQIYTNHCVRATAITLWSNAGLSNRHIMSLSGHRNENSLRSYNARPSSQQLQLCSNVLSSALNSSIASNQNIHSRHDESFSFAGMFAGAQISHVHVQFSRDQARD